MMMAFVLASALPAMLQAQSGMPLSTEISGMISVDNRLDDTGDYAGIGVTIVYFNDESNRVDTLYTATTNRNGMFRGTARFPERDEYVLSVSRNGRQISSASIILQDDDPVEITGEIPEFNQTYEVSSAENDAARVFQRVERNFNRVVNFINSSASEVTQDTIPTLLNTWSDIYWSVSELHPNTLAGETGRLRAAEVIQGWDDARALERAKTAMQDSDDYLAERSMLAAEALQRLESTDDALAFTDSVMQLSRLDEDSRLSLEMHYINTLIDAGRSEAALQKLADFRQKYEQRRELQRWAVLTEYDVANLSPGMPMPDFELELMDERRIDLSHFEGKYALIEVVNLASQSYITEHTYLQFLHEDLKEDIQFLTLPVNDSPVTVQAFYEERDTTWLVAKTRQVYEADLIVKFNVGQQPTRFLIDPEGNIIKKYSGTELSVIENDLRTLLNEDPS
ncbi:MAG: TlpA family protein disulfide reductase [Cyclonatronaceae bacterium]